MRWIAFFCMITSTHAQEHQAPNAIELENNKNKLVSHEIGGGRFGDQLLGYIHAKWISYYYGIPLLCSPFLYSNQLVLHKEELQAEGNTAHLLKHLKACNTRDLKVTVQGLDGSPQDYDPEYFHIIQTCRGMNVNYNSKEKELYWISYFPLSDKENSEDSEWYYFPIDWDNEGFKKELNRLIKPLYLSPTLSLPEDRLSIALHVRRGGGFDRVDAAHACPTKFPPQSYYVEQVRRISQLFPEKALYVYIFTDDPNPLKLVHEYKQCLSDLDIQFDCRETNNHHASNVLEDFFEMMRFDCLVAADSNYSGIPAKMIDYKVSIIPRDFQRIGDIIYIDQVQVRVGSSNIEDPILENSKIIYSEVSNERS